MQNSVAFSVLWALLGPCQQGESWIHFISKTVHCKPLPVLCASNLDLHKVFWCSFKEKKKSNIPHRPFNLNTQLFKGNEHSFAAKQMSMSELLDIFKNPAWKSPIHLPHSPAQHTSIVLLGQPGSCSSSQGSRRDEWLRGRSLRAPSAAPSSQGWRIGTLHSAQTLQNQPLTPLACEARGKRGSLPSGIIPWVWTQFVSGFQLFLVPERQQMPDGLREVKWGAQQDNI